MTLSTSVSLHLPSHKPGSAGVDITSPIGKNASILCDRLLHEKGLEEPHLVCAKTIQYRNLLLDYPPFSQLTVGGAP